MDIFDHVQGPVGISENQGVIDKALGNFFLTADQDRKVEWYFRCQSKDKSFVYRFSRNRLYQQNGARKTKEEEQILRLEGTTQVQPDQGRQEEGQFSGQRDHQAKLV